MVNFQECLNKKYPNKEDKEKVEFIEVNYYYNHCHKNIDGGELDLREYPKLKKVVIVGNYLNSPLTKLDVTGCPELKEIWCHNNRLEELDLSKNVNLEELGIGNNNFSERDLSFLSHLVKLKVLRLGNNKKENIEQGNYNHFVGSLQPLKNLNELKTLSIYNTDIDSGLEHLPKSLKTFLCYDASFSRKGAKSTELYEKELRSIGGEIQTWREFHNSPAQEWLNERYHEDKRGEIEFLNLRDKGEELKGGLKLTGFTKLERLDCQNNQLTNLDLSDCKKLTYLNCQNNQLTNLNFLKYASDLEYLYISDCRLIKGNLNTLKDMNKLEELDISNTNINKGLDCLPVSCRTLYCNIDDKKHKSINNPPLLVIKIKEELDKSGCLKEDEKNNTYYDLDKWREDKANSLVAPVVPLERLFVIKSNIKKFINKWGKEVESRWYEKNFFNCWRKTQSLERKETELRKLQSPEQYEKYWYVVIPQWVSRAGAMTGSVLALNDNYNQIGGGIGIASAFLETVSSQIKEEFYDTKEKKWSEFMEDLGGFLDNYHELLGILEKIKKDDLGKINMALNELRDKTKEFLDKYRREDNNGIISVDELTNLEVRRKLAEDFDKEKSTNENSQLGNIVLAIEKLENDIISYRQGTLNEEEVEKINQQSENQSIIINPLPRVDDCQEESSQQITEETPLLEARQEVRIGIIK